MIDLDRSYYIPVVQGSLEAWWSERKLHASSLPQTVIDIASGQIEDVVCVIEFNAAEGWSRTVTDVVAEGVAHIINAEWDNFRERPHPKLHTWVEKHCDVHIPAPYDPTFAAA